MRLGADWFRYEVKIWAMNWTPRGAAKNTDIQVFLYGDDYSLEGAVASAICDGDHEEADEVYITVVDHGEEDDE